MPFLLQQPYHGPQQMIVTTREQVAQFAGVAQGRQRAEEGGGVGPRHGSGEHDGIGAPFIQQRERTGDVEQIRSPHRHHRDARSDQRSRERR